MDTKNNKVNNRGLGVQCIVLIVLFIVFLFSVAYRMGLFRKGEERLEATVSLEDVIDISELSTARYTYNGIAQAYKDEEKTKVKCNIKYEAEVKAAIDVSQVSYEVDDEAKTIQVKLPQIKLNAYINSDTSISFIPANTKMELKDAIDICEEDALTEASSSEDFMKSAEENLKAVIEGALLPFQKGKQYTIIWV